MLPRAHLQRATGIDGEDWRRLAAGAVEQASQTKTIRAISKMKTRAETTTADQTTRIGQARAALAARQWALARDILDQLAAENPRDAAACLLRARAQLGAGDDDAAADTFRALLKLDRDNTEALISLARHYYRKQDWGAAYEYIQRYVILEPSQLGGHLVSARICANLGMNEASIAGYESVRMIDPANTEAASSLANLYRKVGNATAMVDALERLVDLEPGRAEHVLALALAQQGAGDHDAAEANFRKMLELKPGHRDATVHLARHLSRLKADDEALSLWKSLLASEPAHLEFNVQTMRILDRADRIGEAEPYLLQALKKDAGHVETLRMLGKFSIAKSRWATAAEVYQRLHALEPAAADVTAGRIRALANLGQLEAARNAAYAHVAEVPDVRVLVELLQAEIRAGSGKDEAVANQIVTLQPDVERIARALLDADLSPAHVFKNHRGWTDFAGQLAAAGRWRITHAVLQHAAKKGEPNASTTVLRGQALVQLKHWDEARVFWKHYRALNPSDSEPLKQLVTIAREKGESDVAIKLAEEWMALDALSFEAAGVAARLLGRAKRGPEAVKAWKRAAALDITSVDAFMGLANACFNEGALTDAETAARRVNDLRPGHAEALRLLARVAGTHGRQGDAAELWQQAARANPAATEPHVQQARIFRQSGRIEDAIASYQTVLTLDPVHAEALSAIGRMYRETGNVADAEANWMRWTSLDAKAIEPLIFLARLHRDRRQVPSATSFYRSILMIDKKHAQALDEMSDLLISGR